MTSSFGFSVSSSGNREVATVSEVGTTSASVSGCFISSVCSGFLSILSEEGAKAGFNVSLIPIFFSCSCLCRSASSRRALRRSAVRLIIVS